MGVLWNSSSRKTAVPSAAMDNAAPPPPSPEPKRYGWLVFGLVVLAGLVVLGFAIAQEVRSSKLQAREFSRFAASLSYSMHAGPSDAIQYPGDGPFDKRLGYSALGDFLPRLLKRDYVITQQSRFSPELLGYSEKGFFVPYPEKIQTGLSITDCAGSALYQYNYPQQLYSSFASIPPLVVHSLLFIENRDLLDPAQPQASRGLAAICHGRLFASRQTISPAGAIGWGQHLGDPA